MGVTDKPHEANTRNEILSQPWCWQECFKMLDEGQQLERAGKHFKEDAEYLFIGCGSSYYISQAAAASWEMITGTRAWAVPASELLLFPDLVLNKSAKCQPILVSRSGYSSEIVRAAQYLEHVRNIRTLAISCWPPSARRRPQPWSGRLSIHCGHADPPIRR
jgi:glucosamine--fructose-6-phosphate aminotransferase (isomerizing)